MDGDDFAIQRFVEFYSSTSDIFPDEFHYRESVKIILRFEIIGPLLRTGQNFQNPKLFRETLKRLRRFENCGNLLREGVTI
jgi:hypothetical protein